MTRSSPDARPKAAAPHPFIFTINTNEYRSLPIPGIRGSKIGDCFVRVSELPQELDGYMGVNPRIPNRKQDGALKGPVIRGIIETLTENPENMALKNQGIYLLVDEADFIHVPGGDGQLTIALSDKNKHGIVNGGHTFAAIRDAIENADEMQAECLSHAFVRLHVLSGVDEMKVAEIAEGLNRSKQVDDPSLINLQGHFEGIRKVMKDQPGEDVIAYHQGDLGPIYVTEILAMLEMFNGERFDKKKHPHYLLSRMKSALDFYEKDFQAHPSPLDLLIPRLPEILTLSDIIKRETPSAAKRIGFQFGRMKIGKARTGSQTHKNETLPFLASTVDHHVPNGWVFPMLAAFRANVLWDLQQGRFDWKVPLDKLVPHVIDDLVRVCVTEHRDNNLQPDQVGKRESTYTQCYDKVSLYLLEKKTLN
jgi:AIPR protein